MKTSFNSYQKVAIATILITTVLIMIGSLVRAAGAGLGCPDWPKCFGMWIPPMSTAELPSSFDESLFNPTLMWIEYINRLFGVLTGFFILLTFAFSIPYRKTKPVVFRSSTIAFVLVLFQGWLGGQVVESELHAVLITLHLLVAILILGFLIHAAFESFRDELSLQISEDTRHFIYKFTWAFLIVIGVQMLLGTQVREMVDVTKQLYPLAPREAIVERLGWIDHVHRLFSWVVIGFIGYYYFRASKKYAVPTIFKRLFNTQFVLVALQIVIGIVLVYGGLPPAFQVLHLINSTLLVSVILITLFYANSLKINTEKSA